MESTTFVLENNDQPQPKPFSTQGFEASTTVVGIQDFNTKKKLLFGQSDLQQKISMFTASKESPDRQWFCDCLFPAQGNIQTMPSFLAFFGFVQLVARDSGRHRVAAVLLQQRQRGQRCVGLFNE